VVNSGITNHVGENVARFRAADGLSLAELARRSGVSKRTLSNIEQGNNVTLETLLAVADGLELDLVTLLFDGYEGPLGQVEVVRAEQGEAVDLGARLVTNLCDLAGTRNLKLAHVVFREGDEHRSEALPPGVVSRLFVLSGAILFGPIEDPVRLEQGDFATMRIDQPHIFAAVGGVAAALVLTTTFGQQTQ
jgi:XRE family transcriptional regulator, regulator of sulfur utilization